MSNLRKGILLFNLIAFIFTGEIFTQSVSGIPGYVRVPSASFNNDGTIYFGAAFLPKKHLEYGKYEYDALAVYTSITFLPFLEVDFRITRKLNMPDYSSHVCDRMPSLRLKILKGKRYVPAIVFGFHDLFTTLESGSANHFRAAYIVCSKGFLLEKLQLYIETSIGYGVEKVFIETDELKGLFGGISIKQYQIQWISLLCDYDGVTINPGIRLTILGRFQVLAGFQGCNAFTGCLNYKFVLH